MKVHYLEIVTHDADPVRRAYERARGARFGEPDALLGGARTCALADGSIVGVREPLRDDEAPVVRPYWLVDDVERAVADAQAEWARTAMAPTEIPGKGRFAIYVLGGVDHGLRQL